MHYLEDTFFGCCFPVTWITVFFITFMSLKQIRLLEVEDEMSVSAKC